MKSLLFVQYGDYAQAYDNLMSGGAETYRDQHASVNAVAGFAPEARVTTLAFVDNHYERELAPNLWAVGINRSKFDNHAIRQLLDRTKPSHIILRTPDIGVLHEAARRHIWILPTFADIFGSGGLRTKQHNFMLRRRLAASYAPCFANHSLNASRSMHYALKLPSDRIVPWDWAKLTPVEPHKAGPGDVIKPTVFFAGMMEPSKGVGDCIDAVAILKTYGLDVQISFAGPGDLSRWQSQAAELGIADQVHFLGTIATERVRHEMHRHDYVIVPSRHEYPEGLPNTIYEGLASRSVLLLSNHPAFLGRLRNDEECLMFEASNPKSLADCLMRVHNDTDLYVRLSKNSAAAHDALYVGMAWTDMVQKFVEDPENATHWVTPYTLAALDA